MKSPLARSLVIVTGRLALIVLLTTLCSFLTLDRPILRSLVLAIGDLFDFLGHFPQVVAPLLGTVLDAYWRSLILLVAALLIGLLLGVPLGLISVYRDQTIDGQVARFISYVGTFTPSFLLALLIMIFFVRFLGRWTNLQWIRILPSPGLPDPREILAPALTLAARPVAHIASVTAAHVREQLRTQYVLTAYGKGFGDRRVLFRHVWPNVAIPILEAARSSLRFSLSSLPIVEYVFSWNGIGVLLLGAVIGQRPALVALLLASLGATFVAADQAVEVLSRRLDPRLRLTLGEG
jgi:peptide/nickel transport system permease protein